MMKDIVLKSASCFSDYCVSTPSVWRVPGNSIEKMVGLHGNQ